MNTPAEQLQTVLVVDDEKQMRDTIKNLLEEQYTILQASEGEDALKILENNNVSLVLTDYKMPGMDGIALCEQLANRYPHIPAIVITAYSSKEVAIDALKTGVFDFIEKPFTREHLLKVVKRGIEYHDLLVERDLYIDRLDNGGDEIIRLSREILKRKYD